MSVNDERSRRESVSSAFDDVYELASDDRAAALELLEPSLRDEVAALISALDRKGERLEPPRGRADILGLAGPDHRVGAYRVIRLLGRGGMGAVYEAERADATFVKRVAVKLIRDDVSGETVSRRFARERAILAGLEHPNIARMLDGGTTADGREYLVMELVDGLPITTYCAQRACSVRERLALFLQICDAVQYAHQHLVVHGDIKPGNVLVAGDGTVKLLDFGVAKIIEEGDSVTRDQLTALGALTPAYASPEQWRGEPLTLLTDVYSLGVVLHELLVGARPFTFEARTTRDVLSVMDAGARRPSDRVTADIAIGMRADERQLRRTLSGELDNIVLTALDASPRRRYSSVDRLADDVRRHMDGRIVLAQPATRRYRFSKFLRRHQGGVAAGAALSLTVIGGGIVATLQARRAEHERVVADRISGFLTDMLSAPDASWVRAGNANVRVADVLDAAAARADTGLAAEPAAEAMVRRTIGSAYRALSRFDDADKQLRAALAIDLRRAAPAYPDLADDYHSLGASRYQRGDWKSALGYFRSAARACARQDNDTSVVCYASVADYGLVLASHGQYAPAETLYREVLRRGKHRFLPNAAPLSVAYANLGVMLEYRGRLVDAETMYRSALRAWTSGPEPTERVAFFHFLAGNLLNQNRLAEADTIIAAGLRCVTNTHQERTFAAMLLLLDGAQARRRSGDFRGAADLVARAREAVPPNVLPTHPLLAAMDLETGLERLAAADAVGAEKLFRDAAAKRAATLPPTDGRVVRMRGLVAIGLAAQGRYDEAQPALLEASAALDSVLTPRHPMSLELRGALTELESARRGREGPATVARRFAGYMAPRP